MNKILISPFGQSYKVEELRRETETSRAYLCYSEDKWLILKIAITTKDNSTLDREEFILKTLKEEAEELEADYAKEFPGKAPLKNYYFFPEVVDSFTAVDQENRRVLVLSFMHIAKERQELSPLSFITERDKVAIDSRTSAWMLGKLLKMLVFTQNQGVTIGDLTADNILLNKSKHYVAIFDWSNAIIQNYSLTMEERSSEISEVTKEIVRVLDGNPDTGEIPSDDQLVDTRYQDYLKLLIEGKTGSAMDSHEGFYGIVRSMWKGFHPYTTKARVLN